MTIRSLRNSPLVSFLPALGLALRMYAPSFTHEFAAHHYYPFLPCLLGTSRPMQLSLVASGFLTILSSLIWFLNFICLYFGS